MEDNQTSQTFNITPPSPDKTPPAGVMTLEQLVQLCVRLQPAEAAARGDSALCVTPLITHLIVDGKVVELHLKNGRWGAGYTRVSGEVQRAAESAAGKPKRKAGHRRSTQQVVDGDAASDRAGKAKGVADGYSEEEQITRQIRHFLRKGLAFKIYSDCGLTGEFPTNDPRLIRRLLEGKAARYRKIYERTLLDETSLLRRTPREIASMRDYLERRVATIKDGLVTDNEFADDGDGPEGARRGPGRPRNRVYFRQAFTQLWEDIPSDLVCEVAVSDRSRLCRSADLESEFLVLLSAHGTRLIGLIEDLSTLDVSDPLKKGFAYLIASVNEYRLEETAGHSFRGLLQLLESGHPHGRPPWWLVRDAEGRAVEMPEYVRYARRVADLYLAGLGVSAIETRLHQEGVVVGGQPLTTRMIRYVLESDATSGVHWQFGRAWEIFPRLLPEETVAELRERRQSRRDILIPQFGERVPGRTAPNHVFTGLLRCACGRTLRYSHPTQKRTEGGIGYYFCPSPHKRAKGQWHAWVNEDKLGAFLGELLGENPHLISAAIDTGADRTAALAARRVLLEARLQKARADYAVKLGEAQSQAARTALSAGIGEGYSGFAGVVAEICQALLEGEREELTRLEAEMAQVSAETHREQQASRVLGVVERLRGVTQLSGIGVGKSQRSAKGQRGAEGEGTAKSNGSDQGGMDVLTCNVLLKAVFSEITVHPLVPKNRNVLTDAAPGEERVPHGCLVMRLVGVETPLPPVRMRRGPRKETRLPTVEEWITDMFALAPVEEAPSPVPNARERLAFHSVLKSFSVTKGFQADMPIGLLACRILSDRDFPRRLKGRDMIAAYVIGNVLYDDVREHLDAVWEHYIGAECERVRSRTAAPEGTRRKGPDGRFQSRAAP